MTAPASATAGVLLVVALAAVAAPSARHQRTAPPRAAPGDTRVAFENVAAAAGLAFTHVNGSSDEKYLVETMGSGGLFFDYDNDGWIDVFLVDGGSLADRRVKSRARHRLYRNRGGGTFEDVTGASGIGHTEYGMGACAADYDNDGWVDLYVTNVGANALYHNNGRGAFTNVTPSAGVGSPLWSTSCAFVDVDRNSTLDLFVTNYVDAGMGNNRYCGFPSLQLRVYCHPLTYKGLPSVLYRNNGNGTFTDTSAQAGIANYLGNGLGVVVADYDDDGSPDLFVANDSVPNYLFHNEGRGVFKEAGLPAGVAVAADGHARAGMGTDFGDYDGDGRLDLIVTNHEFEMHTLFRNLGHGLFADVTAESGIGPSTLPFVGFGVVFFDYDNDGSLDMAIVNGHVIDNTAKLRADSSHAQRRLLFHNQGGRRFADVSRSSGPGFAVETVGRTLVTGDVDNDGDLDLLITSNGQPVELLRNGGGNRGHALLVRLVGTQSNRDGVGAKLRLAAGSTVQVREVKAGSSYLGQNDLRVHFGLGQAAQADRLEIAWPSGKMDVVQNVPANHIVTVVEGQGLTKRVRFSGR